MINGPIRGGVGRVGAVDASARLRRDPRNVPAGDVRAEDASPASASRALVAVAPPARQSSLRGTMPRGSAAFVTQLIAGTMGLEHTRQRRRAAPHIGVAAYVEAANRPGAYPLQQRVASL